MHGLTDALSTVRPEASTNLYCNGVHTSGLLMREPGTHHHDASAETRPSRLSISRYNPAKRNPSCVCVCVSSVSAAKTPKVCDGMLVQED